MIGNLYVNNKFSMGKKRTNSKESENGNPITKLSESPAKKSIYSGRSKASVIASLFFIAFIGILSIILGLIFIEINSSSKDLKSGILQHDTIKKETVPHHVKEPESSKSKEALPPSPPQNLESHRKMDGDKNKVSSDADIEADHVVKKRKIEEGVTKEFKTSEKELPINEDKLVEIEKQIIKDHSDEVNKNKETKFSEKDETSKLSPSTGKSKVEKKEKQEKADKISEETKREATLKELYIEVEGLAEDILQEDPQNSMVKELAPHLEGILRDLEGGKISGLRDSLLHMKIILSDLKERLEESKRQKESDVSEASKTKEERVPVDEVIPDPIYIAPLGDADKDVQKKPSEKSTSLDDVSKVETKAREEKKTQDQPKKSPKVDDAKVHQSSHVDREKQQKSENIPHEKKEKNLNEEKVVQPHKDSGRESKETIHTEKSNQQNVNAAKKEGGKLKDKIQDEKSSKIKKSSEDKPSETRQDKRKLSETEKEVKSEKVEESPTDKKFKKSHEKVRETKPSTVEDLNRESDKKNLNAKQTKKLGKDEEQKRTQKDAVKTPEQSSKQSEQKEKSTQKSEESNINLKDKDLQSIEKLENEKSSGKDSKKEKVSPGSKDFKVPEKLKEENLKKSSKETPSVVKTSGNERQVPGTDKEKKADENEGKSAVSTKTNDKTAQKNIDKTSSKEVKSSETDEKLKLASALEDENLLQALIMYDSLIQEMPKSPTVLYRRALVLDNLSEKEQSNPRLEQTIQAYMHIVALSSEINVPKVILKDVGLRCVARMNFRGPSMFAKEREVLRFLTKHFYDDVPLLNKVGIYYLMMNRNEEAEVIFERVLELSPEDGLALVHYGFVLKLKSTDEASLNEAISHLERGLKSNADGVHDVRMYYHLGDALQRLGQNERAYQVFDEAVKRGFFRSRYQRSTHNIHRLKAKPLWKPEETTYQQFFQKIQYHWKEISREGKLALNINGEGKSNTGFREEKENLREKGSWKQLELFARGKKHTENCKLAPFTCSLIEEFKPAAGCKVGQTKFSVMEPGTHVFPHAGPTNYRLRSHLGLVTPDGARMRVVNETLTWEEGKLFIFDDSFEHEVWHEGNNSLRLILIVDVYHPELTDNEIRMLRPI